MTKKKIVIDDETLALFAARDEALKSDDHSEYNRLIGVISDHLQTYGTGCGTTRGFTTDLCRRCGEPVGPDGSTTSGCAYADYEPDCTKCGFARCIGAC